MPRACLRRGALAGSAGGVLAAGLALAVGQPLLLAALAVEQRLHGHDHAEALSATARQVGTVAGLLVVGLAVGTVFGLVAAWAAGRVAGDAWTRHLRLGAALLGGLVVLPALAYPPNPPGAVEPVPGQGLAYALTALFGCTLVAALRLGGRALAARGWTPPARRLAIGAAGVAAAVLLLAVRPDPPAAVPDFPGALLWRFRIASLGVQATLVGGTTVAFGLLAALAERRTPQGRPEAAAAPPSAQ